MQKLHHRMYWCKGTYTERYKSVVHTMYSKILNSSVGLWALISFCAVLISADAHKVAITSVFAFVPLVVEVIVLVAVADAVTISR